MKIVKCDMCGRELEQNWVLNLIPGNILMGTFTMDLCEDCARQVKKRLLKREINHGQDES